MVGPANQSKLENAYVCPSCGRQFTDKLDFCPYDGVRLLSGEENSNSLRRVGAVIGGRYHVDGVLGHGGMGTVFRAVQQPIGRRVAVKVLHPELAQDDTFVSRFHTEAKAASVLVNPNTVTIYDFGQTEDRTLFIAMEYLRGVSLAHRLGRGALPWTHAAAIGVQVCRALSEAHRKGIVHRDLKPENIMLNAADDGSLLIKVLDFGIAKMLEIPGRTHLKGVPVTQVGVIIGTPQYMSPEQVRGGEPIPASDLYALGIILYEALSGAVPFVEEEPILLLGMHMKAVPPPLTSPFGDIPPAFSTLITQLLAKEPAERPGPAGDVGTSLKRIMGDASVDANEMIGDRLHGDGSSGGTGLEVVDRGDVSDEPASDRADTLERPIPSQQDIDRAAKNLNVLPESEDVVRDDDPTGPRSLPEQSVVDEDPDEAIEDLPSESTKRIVYPSGVVQDGEGGSQADEPRLPKEEDRTTMRSVVVEPVPPDAMGLRPDQIMPDQPVGSTVSPVHLDEIEGHPARNRFLLLLVAVLVTIAGAVTGVFLFTDLWQPMPTQIEDNASLVGNPTAGQDNTTNSSLVSNAVSPDSGTKVRDPDDPNGLPSDDTKVSPEEADASAPLDKASSNPDQDAGGSSTPTKANEPVKGTTEKARFSRVNFLSTPDDAEVLVDSRPVCRTPCSESLRTGKRVRVRFKMRGMRSRTLTVVPGQEKVVQVKLRRIRPITGPAKNKTGTNPLKAWLD